MSSPGVVQVNRPVPPLPKDYHTTVSAMVTKDLLRSTLTDESRTQQGESKTCLFYGHTYFWSPNRCRDHLEFVRSSKQVKLCNPYPEHCDHSSEIVGELKERDTNAKQEAREVTKRCLGSGSLDDEYRFMNIG